MSTRPEATRYNKALAEAAEIRWKRLGYKSKGDYRRALERYDLLVQGLHEVTLAISFMSEDDQAKIDLELLALTKKGVGVRGVLLAHIVADIVALGDKPTGEQIAEVIRRVSAGQKGKAQKAPR
jgi:hypothetical protein